MAQVTAVLRDSQEFGEVDPAADWEKWQSRRPEFSLYYAALIDPARDGDAAILCVLRAGGVVMDDERVTRTVVPTPASLSLSLIPDAPWACDFTRVIYLLMRPVVSEI